MGRDGGYTLWRLVYAFALLPIFAVYDAWRNDELGELTPPIVAALVLWEVAVIGFAKWRGMWPFRKG
jgi:hypothetical protein